MKNRHLYVVTGALIVVGLGLFLYKTIGLGLPVAPDARVPTWEIEARIAFDGDGGPAKMTMHLPRPAGPFTVVNQNFVAPGYGLSAEAQESNRLAVLSIRAAQGRQQLYYRFIVHRAAGREAWESPDPPSVFRPNWTGAKLAAAEAIVAAARPRSADNATMASEVIRRLSLGATESNARALLDTDASDANRVAIASGVLGLAGVPARSVHGIDLDAPRRHAPYVHWLEVHTPGGWIGYLVEPTAPKAPPSYYPWWRGPRTMARVEGGSNLAVSISSVRALEHAVQSALKIGEIKHKDLIAFSLFSLPVEIQQTFRILLVIPLGVLVLVILRNVVGFTTFGTFMPVLIALSFRETRLVAGIVLFIVVVGTALAIRLYLESLKLLVVPRLAAVLIVVVAIMAGLSVVAFQLGFYRALSVALFPMVILTMTVERMSVIWDERGAMEALKQGAGSLAVAIICYGVMSSDVAGHLLFVFPELLLALLGATMLLGRYSGYRLTELRRFRELAKPRQ